MHQYEEDFAFVLENLKSEITRYMDVVRSEHISHNDITRTIALINWTARTVAENRDESEFKIMHAEEQE